MVIFNIFYLLQINIYPFTEKTSYRAKTNKH